MSQDFNIAIIPLDNRPVTYSLPAQISGLNNNIDILEPQRELIGGLYNYTDINKVSSWLFSTLKNNRINYLVLSLDTIAYGGLIPSRRIPDTESDILNRLENLKENLINFKNKYNFKIYAYSSIMRISDSNVNEEEKEYWDLYGKQLFKYSFYSHKYSKTKDQQTLHQIESLKKEIPQDILEDYLTTRKRNFNVNQEYLKWIENNIIDYLVYSQDDTAEFGLNVQEAEILNSKISECSLTAKAKIQTGADEIASTLVARAITDKYNTKIKIHPIFSTESGKNVISRYEDKTIFKSVSGQINLAGAELSENKEDADIILLVHTPQKEQNDHCLLFYNDTENKEAVNKCIEALKSTDKPVIIADIAHANGADSLLIEKIIKDNISINDLYGYAGWNTTGNTLGTAISMGISKYISEKNNSFNLENFKKLLLIRFADDWAYQSIVRQEIRSLTNLADENLLNEKLTPYIKKLAEKMNASSTRIGLLFPWNRTFEVEIQIS